MFKKIIIIFTFLALLAVAVFFVFKQITPKQLDVVERKIDQRIEQIEDVRETVIPQPTKILSNGQPDKFFIETAFIPQSPKKNWDQPWQDACEESALLTVDYFYKNQNPDLDQIESDILKMIDFEEKQQFTKDVNLEQMALIAQDYLNYSTEIITPNIKIIKEYLLKNIPIVVPANGKILFKENPYFSSGGPYYHNLVILGYDDKKQEFIVHDVGTQHGAYFRYSYDLLIESIHDFPDSKNKEDIDNGPKQVLLLLK